MTGFAAPHFPAVRNVEFAVAFERSAVRAVLTFAGAELCPRVCCRLILSAVLQLRLLRLRPRWFDAVWNVCGEAMPMPMPRRAVPRGDCITPQKSCALQRKSCASQRVMRVAKSPARRKDLYAPQKKSCALQKSCAWCPIPPRIRTLTMPPDGRLRAGAVAGKCGRNGQLRAEQAE